jgi:hypothetical protein
MPFDYQRDALRKEKSKDHDRQLADAIRRAARKITDLPGDPVKVTRHRIQREIPQIGINRRWENYPLTSQVLEEVTENSEEFALRRIWWLVQQCKEQGVYLKRWEFCAKLHLRKISNLPSIRQALDSATAMLLL